MALCPQYRLRMHDVDSSDPFDHKAARIAFAFIQERSAQTHDGGHDPVDAFGRFSLGMASA